MSLTVLQAGQSPKTEVRVQSKEESKKLSASPVSECLRAFDFFSKAHAAKNMDDILKDVAQKFNFNLLTRDIQLIKKDGASLCIHFWENKLVTNFNGEEHSIRLSNALGIICSLSEIFGKMQAAGTINDPNLLTSDDTFMDALDTGASSSAKDSSIKIDGKDVIKFYPLNGRVVFITSRGQSSMPLAMVQSLSHLFNKKFVKEICPLLGVDSNLNSLLEGVYKIYLGRCVLGLGKSYTQTLVSPLGYQREFQRIVVLTKQPGSAFFTTPLA